MISSEPVEGCLSNMHEYIIRTCLRVDKNNSIIMLLAEQHLVKLAHDVPTEDQMRCTSAKTVRFCSLAAMVLNRMHISNGYSI